MATLFSYKMMYKLTFEIIY